MRLIDEVRFASVYSFKYSPRPGTPAAGSPDQVPEQLKSERLAILQARVEEFVRESGGLRLVLETSGRAAYQRTRRFYEDAGFATVGRIPDFYAPDDDCVVYSKRVGTSA